MYYLNYINNTDVIVFEFGMLFIGNKKKGFC